MAVFGSYETVRELYRGGLASACTAKKVGEEGPARFVVKAYQPQDADPQRLGGQIESFLDGARAQEKCAAGGATHWAAVRDIGQLEDGAYFVTDFHERSVQHLIRGRVKLDARGLHGLISSVVAGLAEFKRACGRPHGNLKPSNILLTGKGELSKAGVLLTDPAGAAQLDPQAGDVPDLHAVGDLIYQLVLHRTGKAMGGWPAPEGQEWDRLGKQGGAWRQLCNRLLNPNLAPGLLSFEDLAGDLEALRAPRAALSPKVLVPVGAVFLLILAGVAVLTVLSLGKRGGGASGEGGPAFDGQAWRRLCRQFGDWVEPLLTANVEGNLRAWQEDPYLKKAALALLGEIERKANPRAIAGQSWGDVAQLGENATKKAQEPAAVRQTAEALDVIDQLKGTLCSEEWPAFARTKRAAVEYAERGWGPPAEHLQSLLPVPEKDVAGRINAILACQADLQRIEERWKEIESLQVIIAAWDDPALKQIGQYIQAEVRLGPDAAGRKSVQALSEKLAQLSAANGLLRRLAEFLRSEEARKLDRAMMKAKPPFELPPDGVLTEKVLRDGLVRLADYTPKEDPRTPAWRAATTDSLTARSADAEGLRGALAKLMADEKLLPADKQDLQRIADQAGAIQKDLESLRGALTTVNQYAAYTYDNRPGIDEGMKKLDEGLKDLIRRIGGRDTEFRTVERRIAAARQLSLDELRTALRGRAKVSATGLAEIDQAWTAQRNALLQQEQTADGLREKSNRLEAFLRDLEGQFPVELGATVEQRPWNRSLLTSDLETSRRSAVSSVLSYVTWAKTAAGEADPSFTGPRDKLVKAYNDLRAGLADVVPAFNRIQDALDAGYLPGEQAPSLGGPSLGAYYAQQQAKPILTDAAAKRALGPITTRLDALKAIEAQGDVQGLLAAISAGRQGQFEAARAAWLRLGKLGKAWLDKADNLRQEVEARKNLATLYGLMADAARKTALLAELDAEGRRRWEGYLVSRTDAAEIEGAIARMADFGLKAEDAAALSPLARFRLAMRDFRQSAASPALAGDDAAVKKLAGQFRATVEALPGGFAQKTEVAALVKGLADVESAAGGGVDLAKAGPAQAGWDKSAEAADSVTYVLRGGGESLKFARVNAPAGPCFLSATEVSLGLFLKALTASGKLADADKLLPGDDETMGIRVWARKGGQLATADGWFPIVPPALAGKLYPAAAPENPTAGYPMQQVSLGAAVYFCRLLNCRLPTSAEWQAAYQADKAVRSAKPHNLRDATWKAQKDHAASLERSGDLLDPERYYPDAGIFWPKDTPAGSRKVAGEAEVGANVANDGMLWFARVQSDDQRTFQYLVGNVAEFVYEDAAAMTALKAPTADAARQFLTSGGAAARVVGGSALSAPQVPVDQPQELSSPAAVEGFADVGFRLAFAAGPEPLHSRLLRLLGSLANQGYLAPASP